MSQSNPITPESKQRIGSIAARSGQTAADIITDALENGHSLDWQERFLERVAKGVAVADNGEFATAAEIERVQNKYRAS